MSSWVMVMDYRLGWDVANQILDQSDSFEFKRADSIKFQYGVSLLSLTG